MELHKVTTGAVRNLSQVLRDEAAGKSRASMTDLDLAAGLLEVIAESDPQRLASCLAAFGNMPQQAIDDLNQLGGVQGLTNYGAANIRLIRLFRVTLENAQQAMAAFQDQDGNMPASTGEFDDLAAVLAQVSATIDLHDELRRASGAAPAGSVQ